MNFPGHSRSLDLLRSSSDGPLTTFRNAEAKEKDQHYTSPQANNTSYTEKATQCVASKASGKGSQNIETSNRNEWPNGPPPSGPRAQRVATLPSASRRSNNENDHIRSTSGHCTTSSSTRQSFPLSVQWTKTGTPPASSRDVEPGKELKGADISVSGNNGKTASDRTTVSSPYLVERTYRRSDSDWDDTTGLNREACWTGELGNSESLLYRRTTNAKSDCFGVELDAAETSQSERSHWVNNPSPLSQKQQSGHPDDTASIVSDLTTSSGVAASGSSSTTSGSRTRTCHKCRRAAHGMDSLFKCSQCPRRYHNHCALPKIPSTCQISDALDWVCKYCAENFHEKDALARPTPQSIPRNFLNNTNTESESSPKRERETETEIAVTLTDYPGSQIRQIERIDERNTFAGEAINGQPKALTNSVVRQGTRNPSDTHARFNEEQSRKRDNSAAHLDRWMSETRTVNQESTKGNLSTPRSSGPDPLLPQASAGHDSSNNYIRAPAAPTPHRADEANSGEASGDIFTIPRFKPFNRPAMNGVGKERELKLANSSSFDHTKHHMSQVASEANHSEDDIASCSTKLSPEETRGISNTVTTTGQPQQTRETSSSKIEVQPLRKSLKHLTCYHWKQRGGCRYREDECQYAHWDTGMDEGKNTTCFWWWSTGHCKKSEKECLYAHRDTGLYAKPPPGYVPQTRLPLPPTPADRFVKNSRADHYSPPPSPKDIRNPVHGLATKNPSSLPQHAVVSSGISDSSRDRLAMSTTDGPAGDKPEQIVSGADPRLSRRPNSTIVRDTVEQSETSLATSKTEMNTTSATAPADPFTPTPAGIEPSSSFNKCSMCDKKVFGSASLCFACKGTNPSISKALKSSLYVPETPELDAEMTLRVEDQPKSEVVEPASPEKPAPRLVNPLKRTNSTLGDEMYTGLFIKKKKNRVLKPPEPRRPSHETSLTQIDTPLGRDKPVLPPSSTAPVGGTTANDPVPLAELIELERLRKQVAALEKSKAEEQRLRAEEKDRADKLNDELQALRVRDREMRKSTQEEQKKVWTQLTGSSRKGQSDEMQIDVTRTPPQLAKRSKTRPFPVRRQSSNDFDRVSEASIQSPLRPKESSADKQEMKVIRDMKARGIIFESDDDSDDGPEVPAPISFKPPKDPLWHPPKSSRDLFEVAPQYLHENLFFDMEAKKKEIAARPSRKQTFGRVLALSDREQGSLKVHREVDRGLPSRMVRTRVPDPSINTDPFKETEQMKEVEMTFEEFLGVPGNALLCLTTTQQLAYRDGALDRWGKLPRVPDDEKFEIGGKGV